MENNNPQFISLIDYTEQTDRHVVIAAGTEEIYQGPTRPRCCSPMARPCSARGA